MIAVAYLLFLAVATASGSESNEAQMARCAWTHASASSATLLAKAKFDARYRYDSDGSPTVGPLMRLRAACAAESKSFPTRSGKPLSVLDTRKFLKVLKSTQPKQIRADAWTAPVYRCEFRFTDAQPGSPPAGVIWGYGTERDGGELSKNYETLGMTVTPEELNALLSGGKNAPSIIKNIERTDIMRVVSESVGKASGKAYAIDFATAPRICQHINSDGTYTDA